MATKFNKTNWNGEECISKGVTLNYQISCLQYYKPVTLDTLIDTVFVVIKNLFYKNVEVEICSNT